MKKYALISAIVLISGCASVVKDVFEIPATPEELQKMSAENVCMEFGKATWRNRPQPYLEAKKEAQKRIGAGEVSAEDCGVFAQMAIRKKEEAKDAMNAANAARLNAESMTRQTTTNCNSFGGSISCTSNTH